jgi:prophage maintenance system killer protein
MELMGVQAEEIRAINRTHGGTNEMNGNVDTTLVSAMYYKTFWLRVASVARSIVKGHLFNDGNKRTGFDTVRLFQSRNNIVTGVLDASLREVMRDIATGQLSEVEAIAARLRGF